MAIATGMRPGALRALRWTCVDLERGIVHVRATIGRDTDDGSEAIVERTKRGKQRRIAIAPPVVDALRRHKARLAERRLVSDDWQDHGLAFDRGYGHWHYQSGWQRYHQDLCDRLGVRKITQHGLRHTAATFMLEAGVHVRVVSEILGHANIQTALDIYSHVSEALQRDAVEAMGASLFGVEHDNMGTDSAAD